MQINRLSISKIDHRPLLTGLDIRFNSHPTNEGIVPQCLIGVNGSGKSQLLETIAEILLYLDETYRKINKPNDVKPPLYFEIDYIIQNSSTSLPEYTFVRARQEENSKTPKVYLLSEYEEEIEEITDKDYIETLLPKRIVGYTSGANETLSFPFLEYYGDYAKYTGDRALDSSMENNPDYDPRLYLMDYDTNIGVVISNMIFNKEILSDVLSTINIRDLKSFQIKIQLNNRKKIETTEDIDNWILWLKNSSSCYEYDEKSMSYKLDFFNTKATRNAIRYFFKNALSFYTSLYKIELLNNLIIPKRVKDNIRKQRREKGILIKPPTVPEMDKVLSYDSVKLISGSGSTLDYINLSDGEHQFLNVFGSITMTDFNNTIFLLDEPETHFNPKWRRKFINILTDITHSRHQSYFITSHSPFIVSDSKREQVYIFSRDDDGLLQIEQPKKETYGSAFDFILKVAFDMDTTVSEKSLEEIRDLQKSSDIEEIEDRMDDFGESVEKFFLYNRLEQLKQENLK